MVTASGAPRLEPAQLPDVVVVHFAGQLHFVGDAALVGANEQAVHFAIADLASAEERATARPPPRRCASQAVRRLRMPHGWPLDEVAEELFRSFNRIAVTSSAARGARSSPIIPRMVIAIRRRNSCCNRERRPSQSERRPIVGPPSASSISTISLADGRSSGLADSVLCNIARASARMSYCRVYAGARVTRIGVSVQCRGWRRAFFQIQVCRVCATRPMRATQSNRGNVSDSTRDETGQESPGKPKALLRYGELHHWCPV